MLKQFIFAYFLVFTVSPALAQDNKQCELISQLTGDYYQHRLDGLSKQQVSQQFRPEFANAEFLRIVDLAINMAFSFSDKQKVETVVDKVYQQCLNYQH